MALMLTYVLTLSPVVCIIICSCGTFSRPLTKLYFIRDTERYIEAAILAIELFWNSVCHPTSVMSRFGRQWYFRTCSVSGLWVFLSCPLVSEVRFPASCRALGCQKSGSLHPVVPSGVTSPVPYILSCPRMSQVRFPASCRALGCHKSGSLHPVVPSGVTSPVPCIDVWHLEK